MTSTVEDFRNKIAWVADALIPSNAALGMPSATEAGMDRLLPHALKEPDDMAPKFSRLYRVFLMIAQRCSGRDQSSEFRRLLSDFAPDCRGLFSR